MESENSSANNEQFADMRELRKRRKPRKFDGMEPRRFPQQKPWPPGKPPGGKLPPGNEPTGESN